MLLNDDNDVEEETLGEYVQSTKQLKKIGNKLRCQEKKDHMEYDSRDVFPRSIDGFFYDSFSYDQQTFFYLI